MSDYKNYMFTIGESPARIYQGLRMSPKPDGFEFGFGVAKLLDDARMHVGEFDANQTNNIKYICASALKFVGEKKILELWNFILKNQQSTIKASVDKQSKTYVLSDDDHFNEWFEMHPGDLREVMYSCIWQNASPFLSASDKDLMKAVKQARKDQEESEAKQLAEAQTEAESV